MSVKIVIADDHNIVRQGLQRILDAEPDFKVVGDADNGIRAVALVEEKLPDILVVDLMMPGLNGLEVTRQVSKQTPRTRIIILSMHQDDGYILQALRAGAKGYVLKESTTTELVQAIHEVMAGERYLSKKLNNKFIDLLINQVDEQMQVDPYEQLTNREREVLQLVAEGRSSVEIAQLLTISSRTVEAHRFNITKKLNLLNTAEIVRYAIKRGIISLD